MQGRRGDSIGVMWAKYIAKRECTPDFADAALALPTSAVEVSGLKDSRESH